MNPQAVGPLPDLQRAELARLALDPKLRVGDLVDELRVADFRLLAEVDLGRASGLGRRADADEEEMALGFGVREDQGGQYERQRQARIHGRTTRTGRLRLSI